MWKSNKNSIKSKLIRNLSISICILLFSILLAADRGVDTWVNSEFDRVILNKAGLLVTLIDEDSNGVEFDFSDEFMPEFSNGDNLEYFQLWRAGQLFEPSESLKIHELDALPYEEVALNEHRFKSITLPDGRSGRMITMGFLPQVDSVVRDLPNFDGSRFILEQKPMQLIYAMSNEESNRIMLFIDVIFLLTIIITTFLVSIVVRIVIEKGLKPLVELKSELNEVNSNSLNKKIILQNCPLELDAVVHGINNFITERFELFDKQKRVTSDIAHELKTPITELITLSEVAVRFPLDQELAGSFKLDVLNIAQRMKNIVSDIMLLQLSSSGNTLSDEKVDIVLLLNSILLKNTIYSERISLNVTCNLLVININRFAIETIFNNVINNAFFYSPENSTIQINIDKDKHNYIFKISNVCSQALEEVDLDNIFEPLWQKDTSRTAVDHFGLGLSIVKSFCNAMDKKVFANIEKEKVFSLTIIL